MVEVKIIKSTFIPAVLEIRKGDTARWVNTEELLHAVTSGKAPMPDDKFNAPFVKKEFEFTFDKAGFYDYFCALHPAIMRGVIIVAPVGNEKSTSRK
jgi:plastocyanin